MSLPEDIEAEIDSLLGQALNIRAGQVVPSTETVVLTGGGVQLDATMLYADLADSTKLAMWNRSVAAKVFKAFLACSTRLIRSTGGEVRSFDGDRVMGVYVGDSKNSSAAKCALQINWAFLNLLRPKFEAQYAKLRDGTFRLAHCTGVDTSEVLAVRAGIRNNNDLIWIGRAPNIAAKMSAFRDSPYHTFISGEVYDRLSSNSKIGANGYNMWEERAWTAGPITRCFRSSWWWRP
jgi:adenylate cyclase